MTVLPRKTEAGTWPRRTPRVGDLAEGPRRAAEVDPGAAVAFHRGRVDRFARRGFGGDDGEAGEPVELVVHLADGAAGVGLDHGVAGAGADFAHHRFAAEDPAFAVRVDFGGGEHDAARPRDRFDQGVVLARLGRLGELDVDGDRLGARRAQPVDHAGVQGAGEGPLRRRARLKVRSSTLTKTMSLGCSWVPRTEKRASTLLQLQRAHQVRAVGENRQAGGHQGDDQQRHFATAPE